MCWSCTKQTSSSSHQKLTCSCHYCTAKLLTWHLTIITHSLTDSSARETTTSILYIFFTENTSEMLANMSATATLEEFYLAIAIATLMKIIRDPNLSQHHTMVVQAITFIFKSVGIKCVPYIQQVIPAYLNVIRTADTNFREVRMVVMEITLIFIQLGSHACK